ncbi:membrane transporter [Phlyctema vagabunda]|uniref:Membrane transporter n=1 Tax=Phlyctema vagabunda TaxID=108571 RepID=A0ABR4PYR9_9HELO
MSDDSKSIVSSFVGALQASLAVLLTICYGAVAARYGMLKETSARDISKTCVRVFLPALLIENVGSELKLETASRYAPILAWALFYTLTSMALGWALRRAFPRTFPAWSIPAICFNNTTALPLVLIQSLDSSGILGQLKKGGDDTNSAIVSRAKSYFLVASVVGNCLTFAVGPKLLDDENAPEGVEDSKSDENTENSEEDERRGRDEENSNNISRRSSPEPTNSAGRTAEEEEEHVNERTHLLPPTIKTQQARFSKASERQYKKLPLGVQKSLGVLGSLMNAPLVGAIVGAVIGLTPPLHKAFFHEPDQGGIFKAWLTTSIKNVGELFAALQLVVVGAKLGSGLLKMKRGEESGTVRWTPCLIIFLIRFFLWPIASIAIIWVVASKTNWVDDDPALWFVLMLMPTGPPATKLTALADVSGASEAEKMSIAKFITLSYMVSPVICFAVVASLRATAAVAQ